MEHGETISDLGFRIAEFRDFRFEIVECRLTEGIRYKAQGSKDYFSRCALSSEPYASLDSDSWLLTTVDFRHFSSL